MVSILKATKTFSIHLSQPYFELIFVKTPDPYLGKMQISKALLSQGLPSRNKWFFWTTAIPGNDNFSECQESNKPALANREEVFRTHKHYQTLLRPSAEKKMVLMQFLIIYMKGDLSPPRDQSCLANMARALHILAMQIYRTAAFSRPSVEK